MSNTPSMPSEITDLIYDIAIFDQTLFVARQTGLYQSNDGGVNWVNAYQSSIPESTIPTLAIKISPNYKHDNTVIAGINGGIGLSTDGGATWLFHQFRIPIPMVTSIAISPNFATDKIILAGTYEDGMFLSNDAGRTWQAYNFGLFDHNVLCVAVSPRFAEDQTVYAGTSSGIYKSINGGRLWHDLTIPNGYDAILSLALSSDGSLYVGTESNGMMISDDSGTTWKTMFKTDSAINAILLGVDNRIITQFDDIVQYSDDGGATWTTAISNNVNVVVLSDNLQNIVLGLADTKTQVINLFDL